jgi:hypothetical protein
MHQQQQHAMHYAHAMQMPQHGHDAVYSGDGYYQAQQPMTLVHSVNGGGYPIPAGKLSECTLFLVLVFHFVWR